LKPSGAPKKSKTLVTRGAGGKSSRGKKIDDASLERKGGLSRKFAKAQAAEKVKKKGEWKGVLNLWAKKKARKKKKKTRRKTPSSTERKSAVIRWEIKRRASL